MITEPGASATLIARLEAATGPSRELDAEIAAALRIVPDHNPSDYAVPLLYRASEYPIGRVEAFWVGDGKQWVRAARMAPLYTSSIAAALTLLPTGYEWDLSSRCVALACADYADDQVPVFWSQDHLKQIHKPWTEVVGTLATPAIALCIVALKARMTIETKGVNC